MPKVLRVCYLPSARWRCWRAGAEAFNRAKVWAVAGLTLGFCVWFFGFLVVAGDYFAMWQSRSWNAQESAFRFTMVILGVLIFLMLPDRDK